MLFKSKHLLKELRKSGRRATAEIISVKTVGEGDDPSPLAEVPGLDEPTGAAITR